MLPDVHSRHGCFPAGCQEEAAPPAQQKPKVGIVTLQAEPFAVTTELPGRTRAYRIAEVRPQVNGIIQKRLFTEGSDVKAGQQLYQIDPSVYEATLKSAGRAWRPASRWPTVMPSWSRTGPSASRRMTRPRRQPAGRSGAGAGAHRPALHQGVGTDLRANRPLRSDRRRAGQQWPGRSWQPSSN